MPICVYEYGLLPPIENAALVMTQMRLAHTYRNKLVEIERNRRAEVQKIMSAHPDMAPLQDQIATLMQERETARQEIKDARSRTRSRSESKEQRDRVRDLTSRIRSLVLQIKEARKEVVAQVKGQLDAVQEVAWAKIKEERARCGVYWGTYLLQEADADAAKKSKTPPHFLRWREEGRVSVQLQGGISTEELFGDDTQVHIDPVPEAAYSQATRRGDRRRASRTQIALRVGSVKGKPVWAVWPMIMHRPLPAGSRIKVATIQRRRRDCRTWNWRLQLTIDYPESSARAAPTDGAVALNLGFCIRPDNAVRAGFVVGDDGWEQEILLPKDVGEAVGHSDGLRSIRDRNMDAMKADFTAWRQRFMDDLQPQHQAVVDGIMSDTARDGWRRLAEYIARGGPAIPYWFGSRVTYIHAWRSADRFRKFAFFWREHRFPGDAQGYDIMENYRYRDEHLERYETNQRTTALRRRRESYRIIASQLARRYRTLVVDTTDLSEFQRSPDPEDERVEFSAVKRNQRLAAGSELRLTLCNAFGESRTVKISALNLTKRCHACGFINEWDRVVVDRNHTCSGCQLRWDQDANAGKNSLAEYRKTLAAPPEETAKAKPSRSQRLRGTRGQPPPGAP